MYLDSRSWSILYKYYKWNWNNLNYAKSSAKSAIET